MTVWLDVDGWDIATWHLTDPPAGDATVDIAGVWHPLDINGRVASIPIAGPDYVPDVTDVDAPEINAVVVITSDVLPRVKVGGVTRTDEWIRLRR